jgi:hypothetical protein
LRIDKFSFGSIRIDGETYESDVVIDRGKVRKRKKKPSRKFRDAFGHTPLSVKEKIPWKCRRLVIGTGTGDLPVMKEAFSTWGPLPFPLTFSRARIISAVASSRTHARKTTLRPGSLYRRVHLGRAVCNPTLRASTLDKRFRSRRPIR